MVPAGQDIYFANLTSVCLHFTHYDYTCNVAKMIQTVTTAVAVQIAADYTKGFFVSVWYSVRNAKKLTGLRHEHERSHVNCYSCEYVSSRYFENLASKEEISDYKTYMSKMLHHKVEYDIKAASIYLFR
jgi:arabinogalactan endo-1,4-beta-galactosidase